MLEDADHSHSLAVALEVRAASCRRSGWTWSRPGRAASGASARSWSASGRPWRGWRRRCWQRRHRECRWVGEGAHIPSPAGGCSRPWRLVWAAPTEPPHAPWAGLTTGVGRGAFERRAARTDRAAWVRCGAVWSLSTARGAHRQSRGFAGCSCVRRARWQGRRRRPERASCRAMQHTQMGVCVSLSLSISRCACVLSPRWDRLPGYEPWTAGETETEAEAKAKAEASAVHDRKRDGSGKGKRIRAGAGRRGTRFGCPGGISRADHIAHVCASVGGLRSNAPRSGPSRIDQLPSASSPPAPAPPRLSVPTHHRSPSLFTTAAASHPPWTTSTPRPSRLSLAWYVMAPIVYSRRPS